jgi:hypothetical protein
MRNGGRWLGAAIVLVCAGCAGSPGHQQAALPTLGRPAGVFAHGEGFGQVRPSGIFNGGDPTGLVSHITWKSWGGARASGTGTSDYVGPAQSVATGTQQPVTVVALYFPSHGQRFNPHRHENICTGTYVPAPS